MKTIIYKALSSVAICATLLINSAVVNADSTSESITDARQEAQIWTTFALSPYLRANDLQVSVNNGKARLNGSVEEDVNKELAEEIALGVKGISSVDNQIKVAADYVAPKSSTRSYGDVIDDASISAAVKSKLLWSKNADGLSAKVTTQNGKVLLTGTADSAAAKELAERLAMNTRGVRAVDNQLIIDEPKSTVSAAAKQSSDATKREISDSWITTKVKSTLIYSSNVDGSDIEVNTNRGVVTLAGKLHSGAERALAIELAENIRGVKSVLSSNLTYN